MPKRNRYPYRRTMTTRRQDEWLKRLHTIEDRRVRMKVAAIVWWDWYGESWKTAGKLKKEFRWLRDEDNGHRLDMEMKIHEALKSAMGYRDYPARLRSRIPKTWKQRNEDNEQEEGN